MLQLWNTRLRNFFKTHIVTLILLGVVLSIGAASFQSGTFLLGWDVTAPELAISLNLERSIFGVWQTYRGLGTLDGMAHVANVIHVLLMAFWKLLVGIEAARPLWLLILYGLGMLGSAALTRQIFANIAKKTDTKIEMAASLISGLAYGLNFYVLQMFYVPLEVFAYQFAALPWLLWSAEHYLTNRSHKALGVFGLITLLGLGQAHVPTVFISSALLFGCMLLWRLSVNWKKNLLSVVLLGLVFTGINASWMLPYTYSAIQKPDVIAGSHINQLSTPEISARNKSWGTVRGVSTMGSFNLDYLSWSETPKNNIYMMGDWREHYFSFTYQSVTFLLFGIAFFGVLTMLIRRKWRTTQSVWIPVTFILFFALLANNSALFGWVTQVLTAGVPFFGEVFRFTFTKFSQPYALLLSVLLGIGVAQAALLLHARGHQKRQWLLVIFTLILIFTHSLPIWKNGIFYKELWVSVPQEYFGLTEYLNTNTSSTEKVAILPSPTLYGWTSNSWGHRGSGFLWQMVRPAMMDRAFDAWSTENETYYQQLNTALSSQDETAFFAVLNQYNIDYILYDSSIVAGTSELQTAENQVMKNWLLDQSEVVFMDGYLTLYQLNSSTTHSPLLSTENTPILSGSTLRTQRNTLPTPYLEAKTGSQLVQKTHPFLWVTQQKIADERFQYRQEVLSLSLPSVETPTTLTLPKPNQGAQLNLPFMVMADDERLIFNGLPMGIVTSGTEVEALENPMSFSHSTTAMNENSTLLIEVNEQLIAINTNEQPTVWLTKLKMDQPIKIRVIQHDQIETLTDAILNAESNSETRIPASIWDEFPETEIPINPGRESVQLHLSTHAIQISLDDGAPVENCDSLGRGFVTESIGRDGVEIRSRGFANACKGFPLLPASSHESFFLKASGSSDAESGLLFGVDHWSTPRLATYQMLNPDENTIVMSVPSAPHLAKQGSSLIVENRSFSEKFATAQIQSIEVFMPSYSIEYLQDIFIHPENEQVNTSSDAAIHTASATFLTPTQIKVKPSNNSSQANTSALVLLQAYDPGWIAFPSNKPWQRLEHAKYNGWANAWLIDSDNEELTILYLPQLLTYAGYTLLLTTLFFLFKSWRRESRHFLA
ncbi:MAG: hypothetical protein WDZ94_00740 [Patescibacteria group bacterium]